MREDSILTVKRNWNNTEPVWDVFVNNVLIGSITKTRDWVWDYYKNGETESQAARTPIDAVSGLVDWCGLSGLDIFF